ncbi:MAG TPA: branched-chain amino acid ABC transporter permease [Alphaproteobacteria bacterium]|nr:branched-chain amino acid ABC transporter permease [Alphaproteobacteria bacterium]
MNRMYQDRRGLAGTLVLGGLLFLIPTVLVDQPYLLHISILICIYAIPAVGLNLMLGYTGLVSLGHMAFAGIGAYVAAILMVDAGWSFWFAMPVAVVSAGVAGALIGIPALRLRSHHFIIVTLAFGMILFLVMNNWDEVTRGAEGFPGVPRPDPLPFGGPDGINFLTLENFYYLSLAFTVAVFVLQWALVRSDFGRSLEAIKQDETLASFKGVNTMAYKVAVFAIGSGVAGLGGVLKVSFLRVAAPLSFELLESINIVLIVVVGGAGFLAGPLLGAIIFVGLPEYLRIAKELRLVIFGAVLLIITLFAPKGLAGMPVMLRTRLQRWRNAAV